MLLHKLSIVCFKSWAPGARICQPCEQSPSRTWLLIVEAPGCLSGTQHSLCDSVVKGALSRMCMHHVFVSKLNFSLNFSSLERCRQYGGHCHTEDFKYSTHKIISNSFSSRKKSNTAVKIQISIYNEEKLCRGMNS